jgi:elongation factor 1-alpha
MSRCDRVFAHTHTHTHTSDPHTQTLVREDRFDAVKRETLSMLSDLGWANVESIPVIPLSGFSGDNIIEPSDETPWWLGVSTAAVSLGSRVMTLLDALDNAVHMPERDALAPLRLSVSNVLVGGRLHPVMTGHVDQGTLKVGDDIRIVPAHRDCPGNCIGIIHSIEKHGIRVKEARPGDVVGIAVKGMDRIHRPIVGDVVVHASDTSLAPACSFTAQVRVSDTLYEPT